MGLGPAFGAEFYAFEIVVLVTVSTRKSERQSYLSVHWGVYDLKVLGIPARMPLITFSCRISRRAL